MNFSLQMVFLPLALVFSGCLLFPGREAPLPGSPEPSTARQKPPVFRAMPQILDYQGKAAGEDIPEWVSRYFTEGKEGLEKMAEYRGKYLFVGENQGINPSALGQWQAAFSPVQDFPQLAAARIEARLIEGAAGSYPDNVYGPFFETMVKKTYDTKFQGAQKEKGFWVRLVPPQVPPAGPEGEDTETGERAERPFYVFLVLLSIDRPGFEARINEIFDSVKTELRLSRGEEAAVNRVHESFFDDSF
jgi:hypothetical protein